VDEGLHATFDICGDGPDRQALEFTADDLGVSQRVRLRGKLSTAECRDVLRDADVFVLSSVAEGISNAVLEAMACGVPVVCTECGGMREAVRDGVEGYLVPPRDPDAMAARLRQLAEDEPLRRRMGAAARQRVLDGFTLRGQVEALRGLYASALDDAR
jgi:glycosyltransferase involved in cell wall biosynthesis